MVTLKDTVEEVGSEGYGPWQYKAVVYDVDKHGCEIHRGICFGTSYDTAAIKVEAYFQTDLINLTLYPVELSPVYDFTNAYESKYDLFTITVCDNEKNFD